MPPLASVRMEKFCLEYFRTGNASGAALLAGYAPKCAARNADKLRKNTKIAQRLAELAIPRLKSTIMDVDERKERLTEFARETIESKYGVIRDGNIRAIAELNRMEMIGTPKESLNQSINVIFVIGRGYQAEAGYRKRQEKDGVCLLDAEKTGV